jgi:hypothetical protein
MLAAPAPPVAANPPIVAMAMPAPAAPGGNPAAPPAPPAANPAPPAAPQKPPVPETPAPPAEVRRVGSRPWLDSTGTAIVGFGILRVVPERGKDATFEIRYEETPTDYAAGDQFQLFILPGDAFAKKSSAYADEFISFDRTHAYSGGKSYALGVSFAAASETTVLVCYGPWTAPDTGRPAGDVPTFNLRVTPHNAAYEWVESEAGELITTNWTNRPGVKRGGPYIRDNVWVEVKPLILYDGRMVRTADEPARVLPGFADTMSLGDPVAALDRRDEDADEIAVSRRADHRITMTRELAEKFRRVPIRWR